jgi:preprotein translocase subunit SecD
MWGTDMRFILTAVVAIVVGTVLGACAAGENDSGPTTRMVLEADTSRLPADTEVDQAMERVKDILERRLEAFDVSGFSIVREGADRLDVQMPGIDPDEARELLGKTALLEFRKPALDEESNIVCETAGGKTYAVAYQPGLFFLNRENNVVPCPPQEEGAAGGTVKWEPATGFDSRGVERVLTGRLLRPNSRVGANLFECGSVPSPCVLLQFTGEGSGLLEQITEELVGLPVAILLDDEIIAAPRVSEPISGGDTVITGLDLDEARTLAIQLNAGALPVPLRPVLEETITR